MSVSQMPHAGVLHRKVSANPFVTVNFVAVTGGVWCEDKGGEAEGM